ncbi:hypothetical protein HK105_203241 [Polyrhizophydium stewartii]|uniref:DUF3455 domain-containing protein n=1 Tax=Polyrhizophydium stewartii TaxID=2732419 RepID=A0ABR4NCF0_9FUNG
MLAILALAALAALAPATAAQSVAQTEKALGLPDGNELVHALIGSGSQVYRCESAKWTLVGAVADLADARLPPFRRRTIVHHFFENTVPTWEHAGDRSIVGGKRITADSKLSGSANVPWLLLSGFVPEAPSFSASSSQPAPKDGFFADVTFVIRARTRGGVAPPSCSKEADVLLVPYASEYWFYRKSR